MNSFFGISAREIEENIIKPSGGIENFLLIGGPGYKIPSYYDDGIRMDMIIEDNKLFKATVAYLEFHGAKEVDK
jgi:hypothetical protein